MGQPIEGPKEWRKRKFEITVTDGAATHGHSELGFALADTNDAVVVVLMEEVSMTNGLLLTALWRHQSWRNSMQLYLQGPTAEDRIKISFSHQPASAKHRLSKQSKDEIIKGSMKAGNDVDNWMLPSGATEHIAVARYLIGGDLNCRLSFLDVQVSTHTTATVEKACHQKDKTPLHGDYVNGINTGLFQGDCQVKIHDLSHETVVARFPWPWSKQGDLM